MENFFKRDRRGFGRAAETVDGEGIFNRFQKKFIVLGKPGAGKTTYLRYLTLMMLNPNSQIEERKLPIFVTLRVWADKKVPLLDFIAEQFDICGFQDAKPFVERLLAGGDCLMLFDGLDEVSQEANQAGIIQQIKDFSDKYGDNQFIISCRVAAYNRWFERFSDVEMADFNEEQIEKFIQNWFYTQPETGKECWQKLQNRPHLKELASVPLLLTLLCVAYNRRKDFLESRASLYEEAIDALLEEWDEEKGVKRDNPYKDLSRKQKINLFARIACGAFIENKYFLEERKLEKIIETQLKNQPKFRDGEVELDGHAILKSIEVQHGILVERAKKVHSFAHLTFQEYFTACYIVENLHNEKTLFNLEKLVDEYLFDRRWREVFLLVAEILDYADEFLLLMHRKTQGLQANEDVFNFLYQAEQIVTPPKKTWVRIYVMSMMLQKETRWTIDFNDEALQRYIIRLKNFTEQEKKEHEAQMEVIQSEDDFAVMVNELKEPFNNWLAEDDKSEFFEYDPDLINHFRKSFIWKDQYLRTPYLFFETNSLILKCMKPDISLSSRIRDIILAEMLLPQKV